MTLRSRALVYIAGPYTSPDPVANTRFAIEAGMALYKNERAVPIIPHLSMFAHFLDPQPVEFWYQFDLHLLARCDVLWRLPGESTGADREVDAAMRWNIPVLFDGESVVAWLRRREYERSQLAEVDTGTPVIGP